MEIFVFHDWASRWGDFKRGDRATESVASSILRRRRNVSRFVGREEEDRRNRDWERWGRSLLSFLSWLNLTHVKMVRCFPSSRGRGGGGNPASVVRDATRSSRSILALFTLLIYNTRVLLPWFSSLLLCLYARYRIVEGQGFLFFFSFFR